MDQHEYMDKTVEILKNRFYFSVTKFSVFKKLRHTKSVTFVCFDEEFKYRNFFNDFGPLNISYLYKYCCRITKLLQSAQGKKKIVHYTSHDPNKKANAAYLVGCFAVICLKMNPFEVYKCLIATEPYRQFVDALQRTSEHTIRLYDCYSAISKSLAFNFFNFTDFNFQHYDTFDLLEKGNLNWIVPRKLLGFLGPNDLRTGVARSSSFYTDYFLKHDIKTVIRLNEKQYDSSTFTCLRIDHYDLYFDDGTVPSTEILLRFFRITETAPAAIAVHCKAGLGRTGTLIGAYLIKHYNMTAKEAVAWLRICRPGSVTGTQQAFLEESQAWLWKMGSEYRLRHYGDDRRIPQHKYGIYSKQWQKDRNRILNEAQMQNKTYSFARQNPIFCYLDQKQCLQNVTKFLTSFRTSDNSHSLNTRNLFTSCRKHKL